MKTYDVLIIGGGPAAITIAKILGKIKKVGVIRPEDYSMIYCAMPYAIEKVVALEKTFKQDSIVTESGADLIRDKVASVDFEAKTVLTEQAQSFGYDKLVIATGSVPFLPPIEGIDFEGVFVFKSEDDLKCLNEAVRTKKLKKAVVVGAGAIGVELALALNNSGLECHLVDMAKTVLPNLLDPEMSVDAEAELKNAGLKLHLGSKTEKIIGNQQAEKIVLDTGEVIDLTDEDNSHGIVVFAVGMRPKVRIFKDSPLEIGKLGIVVDSKMQTNIPDVYSVGDCAQFVSGITGELTEGKLATNAVPMARLLAKNMLGANREYSGFFNGAATKAGNLFIGGTGLSEEAAKKKYDVVTCHSELTTTFPIMPEAKPVKMKLVADRKTLRVLGAQVVSGNPVADKIDIITLAIQSKLTVVDMANFSYSAQPYQSFFPANNLIVACSEGILDKVNSDDLVH
ncbi:FAD-dependent oxidoreductase [uncultured Desulfuromusa sp.]|uniref:FAD-dependent oxidoreductase n=1 Tax=uncultured Desulfuromusa sp. TaxID=219183 RepID=UPI002AA92F26|nr:FAD-dependent oxidoreductase [uncultured Desulfuromusa sp.]